MKKPGQIPPIGLFRLTCLTCMLWDTDHITAEQIQAYAVRHTPIINIRVLILALPLVRRTVIHFVSLVYLGLT